MNRSACAVLALCALASGCGSVIYKPFTIDETPPSSLSIDAKQRLLLVTNKGGQNRDERVVCAEPSPDAMVGVAAALGLEAGVGQYTGKASGSFAEAVAQLGDRTQTVQILRDGLYRFCEAYMNGLFKQAEYRRLLVGYDDFVVTIMAIDGLTQRVRYPPVAVATEAKAEVTGKDAQQRLETVSKGVQQGNSAAIQAQPNVGKEVADAVDRIVQRYLCLQAMLYKDTERGST